MGHKKNSRFCDKCSFRHPAPTGKKCRRAVEELQEDLEDVFGENLAAQEDQKEIVQPIVDEPIEGAAAAVPASQFDALEARWEEKFQRLEKLITRTNVSAPKKINHTEISSDSDSFSEGDEYELLPGLEARRRRREKKHRYRHDNFVHEGENVSGFNSVMLVGVRTVKQMLLYQEDALPMLKHLEFMAKKSTLGAYKNDTYVEYDKAVRRRAESDGVKSFGVIATEEVATSFCPENMYSKDSKSSGKPSSSKKKQWRHCRAFNEGSCSYKNCVYAHVCMVCDEQGHGRFECTRVKAKTGINK